MSSLDELTASAVKHGWSIQTESWTGGGTHTATFTRRNIDDRRKHERLTVGFTVAGAIKEASWEPALDGIGARRATNSVRAWALGKLSRGAA